VVGAAAVLALGVVVALGSGVAASQTTTGNQSDNTTVLGEPARGVTVVDVGLKGDTFYAIVDSSRSTEIGLTDFNIPDGVDGEPRATMKRVAKGRTRIEWKTRVTAGTARVCMLPPEGILESDYGYCPVVGGGAIPDPPPASEGTVYFGSGASALISFVLAFVAIKRLPDSDWWRYGDEMTDEGLEDVQEQQESDVLRGDAGEGGD
jgi:hypothetical protein